ncbi:MAG: glycosyltransferase family 39 protein [Candidatus Omnitrophica bacterium]|nr:glycosyltransferase family 39 protein [Candidatus Omnitrophota bacterium]
MTELARLIASIAIITVIGWAVLSIILSRRGGFSLAEELAVSYGLGLGFITLEMLCFYFLKLPFKAAYILSPWLVVIAMALPAAKNRLDSVLAAPKSAKRDSKKPGGLAVFLLAAICAETFYAFFRALIKPLESYDAIAIYAIKAKILYFARAFPADFFTSTIQLFPHPDYPLNIPLAETFFYNMMGAWNDQLVKLIFPLYFVALIVMCYSSIRRFASRTHALLFTFFLSSIPQLTAYATNGYLDLPLAFYYFTSAVCLFRWLEDRGQTQLLLVSAVMAGLAGWTKNEGMMFCVVNIAVLAVYSLQVKGYRLQGMKQAAIYTGITVVILAPWLFIKKAAGIENSEIILANLNPANLFRQLWKIKPILYEFQKQFFGPKKWNIFWPLALFILAAGYKVAFKGVRKYIALSLALTICGYVTFYMISKVDVHFFLSTTWSRFLLHFLPVVVYWIALVAKDEVEI